MKIEIELCNFAVSAIDTERFRDPSPLPIMSRISTRRSRVDYRS